jgi:hypothetical protein
MINLKIFDILSTFSQNDWNNFVLYIKSSDAISGRKYLPLVFELKNFGTRFSELEKIPASEIFEKAYKKTFKTHTIFNRQSELLNLLKLFLEKNAYKKDLLTGISFYFDELISRNLMDIFYCEYKEKKDIIENDYYNENSFKILSKIIEKKSDYFALKGNSPNSVSAYYESTDALFAEILSNLYKTGQEFQILKQHKLSKYNYMHNFLDFIDFDKLFDELEKQNKPVFIVPLIHYYVFKSLQNPNCKRYISKAKQIYFANEKRFSEKFKLHIYGKIMSYYYFKINNGEEEYFKDLFLLYKRKLKQNLVSDFTEHYFFYNNIFCEYVITGLKVKQYKWVEIVIKKYSPLLPEDIREDEYTLAMVRLYFEKREHEKIFEILNNSKIKNKKIYIDSIYYRLISRFELEKYEECYYEIDNARHYLKNNKEKILRVRALPLKKYLDGFLKLLNYRTNPYNKDINSIYYEFEKLGILKKDWIYSKFQEILEKNNKKIK